MAILDDTICAPATVPGTGAVSVVRVSGPDALRACDAVVSLRRGCCSDAPGYSLRYGQIAGLDDVMVSIFRAPHSYTGEDVVEFQCHGGSVTPRRVLEACFAAGARLARRGEFTERAFLNGKMDLAEAEAVIDLIEAKTEAAADDALAHLGGEAKRRYRALYDDALALSSELEHSLDVDESDLSEDFLAHLNSKLLTLNSKLRAAIADAKRGALLRDGALVVLAGPPNAGKSSLLNALLGENRAIVSDVPGTTRDSIEAWIDLGGIPVRLVDTAGLRGTSDAIESEGVARAEALIEQADIVLMLSPAGVTAPPPSHQKVVPKEIQILSKSDLQPSTSNLQPSTSLLRVSAKTGEGLAELRALLSARLAELEPRESSRGLDLLTAAYNSIDCDVSDPVLAANAVRSAAESLGKLIGATYSADLLDSLFSRFCVGK